MPAVVYLEEVGEGFKDVYLSPQFEKWFDMTVEEALAEPRFWRKLIHEEDLARVRAEADRWEMEKSGGRSVQ
jgi:hypothetical protein